MLQHHNWLGFRGVGDGDAGFGGFSVDEELVIGQLAVANERRRHAPCLPSGASQEGVSEHFENVS